MGQQGASPPRSATRFAAALAASALAAASVVAAPAATAQESSPTLIEPATQSFATMGEPLVVRGEGCQPGGPVAIRIGTVPVGVDRAAADGTFVTTIMVPVVKLPGGVPEAGEAGLVFACGEGEATAGAVVVLTAGGRQQPLVDAAPGQDYALFLLELGGGVVPLDVPELSFGSNAGDPVGVATAPDAEDEFDLWSVTAGGRVALAGSAQHHGDLGDLALNAPVVDLVVTSGGDGYWLAAADGGVFAFGAAPFLGSMGGRPLNAPVVGMAATPTGDGYWLAAADGGVFAFGDAPFLGSMAGHDLEARVVAIAASRREQSYWLVARDRSVSAFGPLRARTR